MPGSAYRLSILLMVGVVFITGCQATATPIPPTATSTSVAATMTNTAPPPTPTAAPPATTPTVTPEPVEAPPDIPVLQRELADVHAYPGPEHYAGDKLTFEIDTDGEFQDIPELTATMTLVGHDPVEVTGAWQWTKVILVEALDTTDLIGPQKVSLTVSGDDYDLEATYHFVVLPAEERPAQEEDAAWVETETDCCTLHTITQTAAHRDVEELAALLEKSASDIAAETGGTITEKFDIYFIDRMWGNGGFGGDGELVLVYTDRFYGPVEMETVMRHELTHAMNLGMPEEGRIFRFNEGLAVFLAGGHYKPEPLVQRGAALAELGYSPTLTEMFTAQHEVVYLKGAVLLAYIDQVYGEDTLWEFVSAASIDPLTEPLELNDEAIQPVFGMSLEEFDREFQAWLSRIDPGEQVDDLRLTIRLQDLRRDYQDRFSLPPTFIFGTAEDAYGRPEALPSLIREAREPENITIELLIANAQTAIHDGRYDEAERLVGALERVLRTGSLDDPVVADTWEIVTLLDSMGYEAVSMQVDGDQAVGTVTQSAPALEEVTLEKIDGVWQIAE